MCSYVNSLLLWQTANCNHLLSMMRNSAVSKPWIQKWILNDDVNEQPRAPWRHAAVFKTWIPLYIYIYIYHSLYKLFKLLTWFNCSVTEICFGTKMRRLLKTVVYAIWALIVCLQDNEKLFFEGWIIYYDYYHSYRQNPNQIRYVSYL